MSSTLNLAMLSPERFQSIYNSLSASEQETMQQILNELSETGESETYEKVWLEDYEEIPVDIDTFLEDPEYLGKATNLGTQIYPFWRQKLREFFAGGDTDYTECVLTGAIGRGKTAITVYAIAYLVYRLMCLRFPQRYFGFADTDDIAIFFFNATVTLAEGVGFKRLHACLMESPWFLRHGHIAGSTSNPYYVPDKHIVIRAGSKATHGLGQQVYIGFLDECNFAPGSNTSIEKSKIMQTYSSVKARIKSRFIKNGKLLGKMFLVSSKKAEDDFLEVYLDKRRKEKDANRLFIVDEPLWVVKPSDTYSGKMFKVAYGAKQLTPRIVEEGEDVEALKMLGYEILDVPVELESDFRFNIITALQDLAGKALPGTTSYFSYKIISSCYTERPNPFSAEVLEIGCNDHMEYQEFFDLAKVPKEYFSRPMAIHLDTSLKNDITGISGACYVDNVLADTDDGTIEKRVYAQVFSVGIKAPPGTEISLAKNRRFIYWLKSVGFNIAIISTDTFQTAESHQILRDKGFTTAIRSLDRTPEGYKTLRDAMMEQRISLIHYARLENELIYLQHDTHTGKLDHPANGCFTSDTKVQLTDGRVLTMEELVREQEYRTNWVYTVNEDTLRIEPKRILKAHQTKITKHLVRITLDNGESITCTPEHLFMLRDGTYVEAQTLSAGSSLMPLYHEFKDTEYHSLYQPAYETWELEYHTFCPGWEPGCGKVVHHRNFKKHDNTPTNLRLVTQSEHTRIHNLNTKDYKKLSATIRQWHEDNRGTAAYQARSEKTGQSLYNYYATKTDNYKPEAVRKQEHIKEIEKEFNVDWNTLTLAEKNALGNRLARRKDSTILQRTSKSLSERHKEGKFQKAHEAISGRVWWTNGVENLYIKAYEQPPEGYRRGRTFNRNHKVVSVEFIDKPSRVYDLTIEDNHNFALACGVFVHNSKDISDSLAGAIWDLSLLPYSPALHNFVMYSHEKEDTMPASINAMFGGLKPYDKYQFERSPEDIRIIQEISHL